MSLQVCQRLPNKPTLITTNNRIPLNNINNVNSSHPSSLSKNINKKKEANINFDSQQKSEKQKKIKNSNSIPPKINFSNDQFCDSNQEPNKNENIHSYTSQDHYNHFSSDNLDSILGEKIRKFFLTKSDNDSIFNDIKILVTFVDSVKTEQNSSIESTINEIKNRLFEYDQLKVKNENLKLQLKKYQCENNDDQRIVKTVKSHYRDFPDSKKIIRLFESDFEFISKIKTVFNQTDNNEAILRTIQSNKETAKDNKIVSELTLQLHELTKEGLASREKKLAQKFQSQYQQEINDKDSEINKLTETINDLKNQIRIFNSTIENLMLTIEYYQKKNLRLK